MSCIDITNILGHLREQLPTLHVHGVSARSLKCHVLSASPGSLAAKDSAP